MRLGHPALRFVALLGLAVWLGGFMFYGGVVVPILDADLGSFDAGQITRKVTDRLNLIGLATVTAWWALVVVERPGGRRRFRIARAGLLLATTLLLAILAGLHLAMDRHLDEFGVAGFRPWHRLYLMTSTAQWGVNLGLLALTITPWQPPSAEP